MTFRFAPAVRDRVGLLIMIGGVSGAGKTLSALKIARGLAGGDDSKIAFIDTEAGRGKHYSPAPGEQSGPNRFAFAHGDLRAPFSPAAYSEAIKTADAAGFEVIVIDSASHLWEGEGGVQDMHDHILDQQVEDARKRHNGSWEFDEGKTRERLSVGAWKTPKQEHKRFVSRLLQTRAHLILCMRADEKMRIEKVKDDRGRERTVIIQAKDLPPAERWSPICEKRLPYEMVLSLVLAPDRPGYPVPIKLQEQHRAAVPLDRPLSEDTGYQLAAWARGETVSPGSNPQPLTPGGKSAASTEALDKPPVGAVETSDEEIADEIAWDSRLATASHMGMTSLQSEWSLVPATLKPKLKAALDRRHKPTAAKADKEAAEAQPA